jgi:hypothetical protein
VDILVTDGGAPEAVLREIGLSGLRVIVAD